MNKNEIAQHFHEQTQVIWSELSDHLVFKAIRDKNMSRDSIGTKKQVHRQFLSAMNIQKKA
jgi:hypothetical protein